MPKLLGEFLLEQQEPFSLAVYLLERGYCTRTRPNARFLKIKRRHRPIPNCAGFVRGVLRRLHDYNNNNTRKIKNLRNGCGKIEDHHQARATTVYCSSCSESEVEADTNFYDRHELSPISVLQETESEASPLHQKQYSFKKTKGESSKNKPNYKSIQNFKECMNSYDDEQYCINKRSLQQSKKLLVDCVREVIEIERRRDDERGQQLRRILGAEELWKVVCENVWKWSQESIHEKNILNLVNCDLMASLEDDQRTNSASDQHKHEVSKEIADAVLEDLINEIIVTSY